MGFRARQKYILGIYKDRGVKFNYVFFGETHVVIGVNVAHWSNGKTIGFHPISKGSIPLCVIINLQRRRAVLQSDRMIRD